MEGFDIDNSMNRPELDEWLNQETLAEDLQTCGRDLVILNVVDSTVDILANRADSSDKFTVVGASLGGRAGKPAPQIPYPSMPNL